MRVWKLKAGRCPKKHSKSFTLGKTAKYVLTVQCSPGLAAEIENNYAVWLKKAKDAELTAAIADMQAAITALAFGGATE